MSFDVMAKVFKTVLPPIPKGITLALADHADDNGYAFPSLRTIRYKASVRKSALAYHLKALENLKILVRVRRFANESNRHTSTAYFINLKEIENYIFNYKNLNATELKELETKITLIEKKYQKEYQGVRNYKAEKAEKAEKRKSKSPQSGESKLSEKPQSEQPKNTTCVDNLNHQSNIDEEELNLNFDSFYRYLNSINVFSTKNIEMHKNTIKVNLLKGHKFTMQNYKDFIAKNTAQSSAY